jgi:hypothetical protein
VAGIGDVPLGADCTCAARRPPPSAVMEIGDFVTYEGKTYVLRGVEPMSVPDRRAEIEDPHSGERRSVPVVELSEHGSSRDV